jgi:hypothetical protein
MKIQQQIFAAMLLLSLVATSCGSDDDGVDKPKPTITSFTPDEGLVGATVTISGTNFSTTPNQNTVQFNNTTATVTASTATQITTTVPAGATSGKISVTVDGEKATSAGDFIVLVSPAITSFDPLYALPGATVTITGTNFSTTAANNEVTINGITATVNTASATSLVIVVPENTQTGKIEVTTAGGTATSADDFEVLIDVPRTGLVAFYQLDGNGNDASGNALNGTVAGAVGAASRFGKAGKSMKFDGTDDKITIGNPAKLQISNTITVAGWVNIEDYKAANSSQAIITKIYFDPSQGGNPTRGYRIAQDFTGNGTPYFYTGCYSTVGLPISQYSGNTLTEDVWIFFAMIIDGKAFKFYHNNTLVNDLTVTQDVNILDDGTLGDLVFGAYGGGFYFDGYIDDITIYDRALTHDEVLQLYSQTVTKY